MTHVVSVSEQSSTVTVVDDPTSVDTALTNALVSTVAATSTVGVSPYTIIDQSTGGGGGGQIFSMDASTSVGATTLVLTEVPPLGFSSRASLIAIDPGSVNCEVRSVTGVSSATVTLDRTLAFSHSAAAGVVWLVTGEAPLGFWGAKGDNDVTDDTAAVQAAITQSALAGSSASSFFWVTGSGCRYGIREPLIFPSHSRVRGVHKFKAATGTWTGPAEANNAMGMSCARMPVAFTANSTTNVITTAATHQIATIGNRLVMKGPALPGGITSGKVYYVLTIPTSTTLTVSATSGGATLDITSAGSGGTLYGDVQGLERVYLDDVYFDGGLITGLNGFLLSAQQPCEWRKVRFDSFPGEALNVMGQIGYFYNLETVSCGKGVVLDGTKGGCTGMAFWGFNIDNTGGVGTAIESKGSRDCVFYAPWLEDVAIGVHIASGGDLTYSLVIDTPMFNVGSTSAPFLKNDSVGGPNSSSYEVRGFRSGSSTQLQFDEVDRGFQLTAAQIDQHQSSVGVYSQSGGPVAPFISNQSVRAVTTTYTAHLGDGAILGNATGGAFTVTLPSAVGIKGKEFTIKRTNSGANALTVGTTGGQTIDLPGGAAATTRVLGAQYSFIRALADGANYVIVGMAGTVT